MVNCSTNEVLIFFIKYICILNKARGVASGDVLIVGVNYDESICKLKGPERP